ncbi:MAG TPA: alanyl-tRNA editing protein [Anaerolineaceae bacterium]|nr:alanyl-tRNA editing protein [Anaerolineaceae bacterium]
MDQTAFYPGGGGQPYDTGTLDCGPEVFHLRRAQKVDDRVWHWVDGDGPLPESGTTVTGKLEWTRRYRLMRTHTAMHILCGVVFRDYGALVTGGDMEPLIGRMDFEFETMSKDLVGSIETAINLEVQKARQVIVSILPREEAFQIPDLIRTKINLLPVGIDYVRVVNIQGLDMQADGGTHVRNTAEVGKLKVVDYKSKGKINKRIYLEIQD